MCPAPPDGEVACFEPTEKLDLCGLQLLNGTDTEGELARYPEVPDEWVTILAEKDVAGLDVAMDDTSLVEAVDRVQLQDRH